MTEDHTPTPMNPTVHNTTEPVLVAQGKTVELRLSRGQFSVVENMTATEARQLRDALTAHLTGDKATPPTSSPVVQTHHRVSVSVPTIRMDLLPEVLLDLRSQVPGWAKLDIVTSERANNTRITARWAAPSDVATPSTTED